MSALSPSRQLLRDGAFVVMTPPPAEGAESHEPVIVTVVLAHGDVTTTVAAPRLTPELWATHTAALSEAVDEVRAHGEMLQLGIARARSALVAISTLGGGATGLGLSAPFAGLFPLHTATVAEMALVAGPTVLGAAGVWLTPLRTWLEDSVKRVVVRAASRWTLRAAAEEAGWASRS